MALKIVLMLLFMTCLAVSKKNRNPHERFIRNKDHESFDNKYQSECKSNQLTCVPEEDCEVECPFGFQKLDDNGACYYFSTQEANRNRTFTDAKDFCGDLSARLLWIEDSNELRNLITLHLSTITGTMDTDMTDTDTDMTDTDTTDTDTDMTDTDTTDTDTDMTDTDTDTDMTDTDMTDTDMMDEDMTMDANMTAGNAPILYYISAKYDKHKGAWIWKDTHDEIDWNIILFQTPNASESIRVIEDANINNCLVLDLPTASSPTSGSLVKETPCIQSNRYICKMGAARSRCAKTSTTKCCFSPSYDFYSQNRELGFANLNLRPGGCQMKIGNEIMKCRDVLSTIRPRFNEASNTYAVARIGSSYYYLGESNETCIGRNAIIQDEDVHAFVTLLLATRELFYEDRNVAIGLTFRLDNLKAYWENGKPEEYYDQFWYPGEPKRDESVDGGCAAYTNVPDTATFLWRLYSADMCEGFDKVCELPLFQESIRRSEEKECGKRNERGVLAKSLHSVYSTNEANFGEFPWQAAIMYPEKYGREVRRKFACSGALIHRSFVLSSAHCVTSVSVQKDFVVVLGQHNLRDDDPLLEPIVMDVAEVIVHNDFSVRQSYLDDLALLQLDGEVDLDAHPHIGLGCLPDPDDIRSHGGEWECFVTGWSSERKYGRGSKVLQRMAAEFTSEEFCRYINREYYDSLHYGNKRTYHQRDYNTNYYRSDDTELLCTNSFSGDCLDDPSPLLVCKKASKYVENPFFSSKKRYGTTKKTLPGQSASSKSKSTLYDSVDPKVNEIKGNIKFNSLDKTFSGKSSRKSAKTSYKYEDDYIVNAYGEDRFGSDDWYVIGIGNTLSDCRSLSRGHHRYENDYGTDRHDRPYSRPYNRDDQRRRYSKNDREYSSNLRNFPYRNKDVTEVFTSVYDYINFIYYILDLHQ